jgi:uncharacterized membrane protein YdjX (TVP38/TMEM64 family)
VPRGKPRGIFVGASTITVARSLGGKAGFEASVALTLAGGGRHVAAMQEVDPAARRRLLIRGGALGLIVLVAGVLVLRGVEVRPLIDQGMAMIRGAGPWVFFGAMAVLPVIGAPLMAFTIPAGEAFAGQMTLGGVLAATLAAIAINLALTYWLARRAVRPLLERLLRRFGYTVPRVTTENALSIALLVRLTPGPPFFLQGYILGLADVPFRLYMLVSWLCVLPWAAGAVVLGRGMLNGNFKMAAMGFGVIIAAVVAVHLIRRKVAKREG